jgi:acyl-CoA thioester hydrolase
MQWPVTYRRKVRYSDTDAQGNVFNANYLRYFDDTITDYFDAIGLPPDTFTASGHDIVLARAEVDYLGPARIGDVLVTGARVASIGTTSVRFAVETRNEASGAQVVRGMLVQVVVDAATFEKKPVPAFFIQAIERLQGSLGQPLQDRTSSPASAEPFRRS